MPAFRIAALLFVLWPGAVLGFCRGPDSYAIVSQDGSRILAMIGGYTAAQEHRLKPLQLPDGRKIDIRASFPQSGAYDAKTLKPLWQANIYALDVAMASTSDFSDIAILGRQGWGGRSGLSFYHEGKLTRRYTCPELVRHLKQDFFFLFTNDDWHLVWYGEMTVDGTKLNFTTANRSIRYGDNFQRFREV